MLEQAPARTCGPVERGAHAGAGLLARACDSVGDPRWSSLFLKSCSPWQGPTLEQFVAEGLYPMGRTHAGAGAESKEDGVAETACDELTTTPIPFHRIFSPLPS